MTGGPFALALKATAEPTESLGQLHQVGQYWIWAQRRPAGTARLLLLERRPEGVIPYDRPGYFLHVVPAGMPHHVTGLFGYWLTADADRVWLQLEQADETAYVLVAGGQTGVHRRHLLSWFCPKCGRTLLEQEISLTAPSPREFLLAERAAIQRLNGEPAAWTCPDCGFVHPRAYGMGPAAALDHGEGAAAAW